MTDAEECRSLDSLRSLGMTARYLVRTLAMALVCVASAREPADAQIRGTATYRERIALPPEAVFDATLEEVSQADAPPVVLGRARVRRPRTSPIRFEIPFDAGRIEPGRRYVVRARILVDGRPLLATDQSYPVLTRGNGRQVALQLRRSAESDLAESSSGSLGDALGGGSARGDSAAAPSARARSKAARSVDRSAPARPSSRASCRAATAPACGISWSCSVTSRSSFDGRISARAGTPSSTRSARGRCRAIDPR